MEAGRRQLASGRASEVRPAARVRSTRVVPPAAPFRAPPGARCLECGVGFEAPVPQVGGFEDGWLWPLQFGFRACCK